MAEWEEVVKPSDADSAQPGVRRLPVGGGHLVQVEHFALQIGGHVVTGGPKSVSNWTTSHREWHPPVFVPTPATGRADAPNILADGFLRSFTREQRLEIADAIWRVRTRVRQDPEPDHGVIDKLGNAADLIMHLSSLLDGGQ